MTLCQSQKKRFLGAEHEFVYIALYQIFFLQKGKMRIIINFKSVDLSKQTYHQSLKLLE